MTKNDVTISEAEELHALRARMARIDDYRGSVCESSTKDDPCGPVEYSDAEGVPLCAECYADLASTAERSEADAIATLTEHLERFEDVGAAIVNGQRYAQVLVRVAP